MGERRYRRGAYHGSPRSTAPPRPSQLPGDEGEVLATLPRGESDELRLLLREYEGRPFLALQVYSADDAGELVAVRGKLATLRLREIPEVVAALRKAEARLAGGGRPGASAGRSGRGGKIQPGGGPELTGFAAATSEWVQPTADEELPF